MVVAGIFMHRLDESTVVVLPVIRSYCTKLQSRLYSHVVGTCKKKKKTRKCSTRNVSIASLCRVVYKCVKVIFNFSSFSLSLSSSFVFAICTYVCTYIRYSPRSRRCTKRRYHYYICILCFFLPLDRLRWGLSGRLHSNDMFLSRLIATHNQSSLPPLYQIFSFLKSFIITRLRLTNETLF